MARVAYKDDPEAIERVRAGVRKLIGKPVKGSWWGRLGSQSQPYTFINDLVSYSDDMSCWVGTAVYYNDYLDNKEAAFIHQVEVFDPLRDSLRWLVVVDMNKELSEL